MSLSAAEAFQVLGIPRGSDRNAIAHAYRQMARTVHPDVSADRDAAERFARLADAYRIATAAPGQQLSTRTAEGVPVRRPWPGPWSTQEAPIVAGPVRIRPSSDHGEGQHHG